MGRARPSTNSQQGPRESHRPTQLHSKAAPTQAAPKESAPNPNTDHDCGPRRTCGPPRPPCYRPTAAMRPAQGPAAAQALARPCPSCPKLAATATTAVPHGGVDTVTRAAVHARPAPEGSGAGPEATTGSATGEPSCTHDRQPPPATPETLPEVPPTGDVGPGATGYQGVNADNEADDPHQPLPTPATILAPHGQGDTVTRPDPTADSTNHLACRPTDGTIGGPSPTRPDTTGSTN